jgi:hypothetical protein
MRLMERSRVAACLHADAESKKSSDEFSFAGKSAATFSSL